MSRSQRLRNWILAGLFAWPVVHMVLSARGHFSPWRYAGWGMYATPYPSAAQHPLSLLLEFEGLGGTSAKPRPVMVISEGKDVSAWLVERVAVRFFVRSDAESVRAIQLGPGDVLKEIASEAMAVRQLDQRRHLERLARLIQHRLSTYGERPSAIHLSLGDLRADPLANVYGVESRSFRYAGSLEIGPVSMATGKPAHHGVAP